MRTISTGQPSTVGTFYGISKFFGKDAELLMKGYMDKYGPDEEIIAEEGQMLYLFANAEVLPKDFDLFEGKDDLFEI